MKRFSTQLGIVFRREYLSRVRHKYFLLTTFLAPLGLALLMFLPALSGMLAPDKPLTLYVLDPSGKVFDRLRADNYLTLKRFDGSAKALGEELIGQENAGGLLLPEDIAKSTLTATFISAKAQGLKVQSKLQGALETALREVKLAAAGIPPGALAEVEFALDWNEKKIADDGSLADTSTAIGTIVGYAMAFLLYFLIAIYGSMVMRSVLEEKTNRIVEIIISSARPLDLMFGKLLGIAGVGLTQIALWAVLMVLLTFVGTLALASAGLAPNAGQEMDAAQMEEMTQTVQQVLNFDWGSILLLAPVYFLGGFLMYGALYAAVAASADQESDVQTLSSIIFIPLFIPIVLLAAVVQAPNSGLAIALSHIPFTSPVVMPVRVAIADVPIWEIFLSLFLLVGGIAGLVWAAARIYRTGLLLYGQKPTLLKLLRWAIRPS